MPGGSPLRRIAQRESPADLPRAARPPERPRLASDGSAERQATAALLQSMGDLAHRLDALERRLDAQPQMDLKDRKKALEAARRYVGRTHSNSPRHIAMTVPERIEAE